MTKRKRNFIFPYFVALACALIMAGCAVGPDFQAPAAPVVKGYTPEPIPPETVSAPGAGGATQRFIDGLDIPGQWWTLFHSEPLDSLIRKALRNSPTIAAAQARLREAEENLRARQGTVYFPSVDGSFSATRQQTTGASFGQPALGETTFNLYNASVSLSYALDIFGGNRRELEALLAQVNYQQFRLEASFLALTSNIVTAAVSEASLRARIKATDDIVAMLRKQLDLVSLKYEFGGASRPDVLEQRTLLDQTLATLPPLEKELAKIRHQLAVYTGSFAGEGGIPDFQLESMDLPVDVPVSVPASLVRQRPDIRASEELLHAACAQVGVATANLYPKLNLSGSIGTSATKIEDLFSSGSTIFSLGAGLLQPLFHGGELTAKRRAAIAVYDQALAQYRETVLVSFREVADTLRALELDAQALRAQADAEASARETLGFVESQFRIGAVNYLSLLVAQRQYSVARINLVQAQATRYADTAALFQALGGGWWNRDRADADTAELKR
ncbi:MAG: Outer membrane protein OprM precursor [Syntrophus sp. PtaB.Bin001]|nr:MAG: Outer membrane protein OprM precursor [Syntrophus sp. PtaB.Bin001]